jgi:hypothetical protein
MGWDDAPRGDPRFARKPELPRPRREWAHLKDEELPDKPSRSEELLLRKHQREQQRLKELAQKPLFNKPPDPT